MMIGIEERSEMANCRFQLEDVLRRLDRIGAGIAAIHVDAAIAQLQANMEASLQQDRVGVLDEEMNRAYALPPTRH